MLHCYHLATHSLGSVTGHYVLGQMTGPMETDHAVTETDHTLLLQLEQSVGY